MEIKNMQDKTDHAVACPHCAFVIIPARRIHSYRERDIQQMITNHKCTVARESKRDFEQEIG